MPILIPSKNIYHKNISIIRNNIINKVAINELDIHPYNGFNENVFNQNLRGENTTTYSPSTKSLTAQALNQGASSIRYIRGASTIDFDYKQLEISNLLIPKVLNNKRTVKITDINFSLKLKVTKYTASASYQPQGDIFEFGEWELQNEQIVFGFDQVHYLEDISKSVASLPVSNPASSPLEITAYHNISTENNDFVITSYLKVNHNNNWSVDDATSNGVNVFEIKNQQKIPLNTEIKFSDVVKEGIEYYKIETFKCLSGFDAKFSAAIIENANQNNPSGSYKSNGYRCLVECEEATITVQGDTIGISITEKTITHGNGSNIFTLNGNELIQSSTTRAGEPVSLYLAHNVITDYKNGKETATIRCSISDYYDSSGNKVISISDNTLPMTLKEGDIVIPYVLSTNNSDIPLSVKNNGLPKEFEIISISYIYDGAVWQELKLSEYT